jgi:methyl-accepting chemotaxis protein
MSAELSVTSATRTRRAPLSTRPKITVLAAVAVAVLAGLGVVVLTSASALQRLSADHRSLVSAQAALIDLDMQQSNATVALSRAVLATTDLERQHADSLLAEAGAAARGDLDRLGSLVLPAAAAEPLAAAAATVNTYLGELQAAFTAAKETDPASAQAKAMVSAGTRQATVVKQRLTETRAVLDALSTQATGRTSGMATLVTAGVVVTVVIAVGLLGGIGWALVRVSFPRRQTPEADAIH